MLRHPGQQLLVEERRALAELRAAPEPVVLFEAPGRLRATLGFPGPDSTNFVCS